MYLGAEHLMGFLMLVPSAQWYSYLGETRGPWAPGSHSWWACTWCTTLERWCWKTPAHPTWGVWQHQLTGEPQDLYATDHTRGFMQSLADKSVLSICLANSVLSEQLLGESFHHEQIWWGIMKVLLTTGQKNPHFSNSNKSQGLKAF